MTKKTSIKTRLLVTLLCVAAAALGYAPATFAASLSYVTSWGEAGESEGQFASYADGGSYFSLAVGENGYLYSTDTFNYRVQAFDLNGNFVSTWGNNVAVDIDAGAEVCTANCQAGEMGTGPGEFEYPTSLSTDKDGAVWVESADNSKTRLQKFEANGEHLESWGIADGSLLGSLAYPASGISVDNVGKVHFTDTGNNRYSLFSGEVDPEVTVGWSVATDNRGFQTCESPAVCRTGEAGPGRGQFDHPQDVYVGLSGTYIADTNNDRVQKFTDTTEKPVDDWAKSAGFKTPRGVAVDGYGNIYVADTGNKRVVVLDSAGNVVTTNTTDVGTPLDVAVNSAGDTVFVADAANNRIVKLAMNFNAQTATTTPTTPPVETPPPTTVDPGTVAVASASPTLDVINPKAKRSYHERKKSGRAIKKRKLKTLKGTATGGSAQLTGVVYKLAREKTSLGKKRCYFLNSKKKLARQATSCKGKYRKAKGTDKWSITLPHLLKRGTYKLSVKATNSEGASTEKTVTFKVSR